MQEYMFPAQDLTEIFSDLDRVPQDDGHEPVCVIQYPTSFTIAYDYMRAVWKAKEFSERTLKLSGTCLKLNPANYTVWHYRRQCMQALAGGKNSALSEEVIQRDLDFSASLGGENPKNYQIWYHRRALLEKIALTDTFKDYFLDSERKYVAQVLQEDSKNYHAWSHRQWIIQTVNDEEVWKDEIEYAHKLILQDPRNNSAWNQRWFAVHRGSKKDTLPLEVARHEADYAILTGATLDPYNESPWRYLIGVLKEQPHNPGLIAEYETKTESLRTVLTNALREPEACANWTSARIDLLEMIGDKECLEKAVALAKGLANEYDPIRKKYWLLRVDQMKQKIQK